jgi:hypothetical protein
MDSTRPRNSRIRALLAVNLLAGTAWSGCGPDGAGTIHIESPEAHRRWMQTGAGPGPTVPIKLGPSSTPGQSPARPAGKEDRGRTH